MKTWLSTLVLALWIASGTAAADDVGRPVYRSPWQPAFSPDGRLLAVSDPTAGRLVLFDTATGKVATEVALDGRPSGVVWSADGRSLYVAQCMAGTVAQVDTNGRVMQRMRVGPWPVGVALAPKRGLLLAANSATNTVSVINLADGRERTRIAAGHMPYLLDVTPDERLAVVGNRVPAMDASKARVSATVTLLDLESFRPTATIRLPGSSTNVHDVAVSPDGRWAYVVHNLGRVLLPTEQIEYGWISANAMSTIDLKHGRRYATILLDQFNRGAANPWGVAVSKDGATLWITLGGVHQLARVDLARMHQLLRKDPPPLLATDRDAPDQDPPPTGARGSMAYSDSWRIGLEDPTSVEVVVSDLPAEYGQGRYLGRILQRFNLPGNGPRGVSISSDGKRLAVASYYSGTVTLLDAASAKVTAAVAMPRRPKIDAPRRGEMIFHDARYCFQQWFSCVTCHPDGRADGLNWDLLNDGIGNPKNTKSLLFSHRTPPAMSRGIRANMEAASAAGFQFLLFQEPKPEELEAVRAYLRQMRPAASPYLVDGRLSELARRGKALFENPKVGCSDCHPAPLFTELKMHDVGTRSEADEGNRYDTPTLLETWRTAPYLHHGRAATLQEVLTKQNPRDRHGHTSHLSKEEIGALVEYLRSL